MAHKREWWMQRLSVNPMGRDIIVGDVHGAWPLLERELERIGFDREIDRLVCAGDLIDRGPASDAVCEWLAQPWCYATLDNHELSLIMQHGRGDGSRPHFHLSQARSVPQDDHEWFKRVGGARRQAVRETIGRLPIAIEIETVDGLVGVVHADLPRAVTDWGEFRALLDRENVPFHVIADCLWSGRHALIARREAPDESEQDFWRFDGVAYVVHGHSLDAAARILTIGNRVWIETGGWLSATASAARTQLHGDSHFTLVDARRPWHPL